MPKNRTAFFSILCLFALVVGANRTYALDSFPVSDVVKITPKGSDFSDSFRIKVRLVAQARCTLGDLDALTLDLRKAGRQKSLLQLSVESIDASKETVQFGILEDLTKRTGGSLGEFEVTIPYFESPTVLGVYLCSTPMPEDGKPNRACSRNILVPFSTIMAPHKLDLTKVVGKDGKLQKVPAPPKNFSGPGNRIYFFRFVVAHGDSLYVPTSALSKPEYLKLASYLQDIDADTSSPESTVKKLSNFGLQLDSVPLRTDNNTIEIVLPYYSPKKCVQR